MSATDDNSAVHTTDVATRQNEAVTEAVDCLSPDEVVPEHGHTHKSDIYVCRVASVFFRMPSGTPFLFTSQAAVEFAAQADTALRDAMEKDPRITQVLPPAPSDAANARTHLLWDPQEDEENLVEALRHYRALRLNIEVMFRVRVPKKNQPIYRGLDDVPTDEYLALWDGVTLYVQWTQATRRGSGSGGHVVLDVLGDVVRAAGYEAVVQACAPSCHHKFIHLDIVTLDTCKPPDRFEHVSETPVSSVLLAPYSRDDDDHANLRRTFVATSSTLNQFAEVKNTSDMVMFLGGRLFADSTELTSIAYQRAARRPFFRRGALTDLWHLRGTRRQVRQLLAGLWLALSMLTVRQLEWKRDAGLLRSIMKSDHTRAFRGALDIRASEIEELNVDTVRTTLEDTGARQQASALIFATLCGAIAVLAGAVLAHYLT